MQKESTKVEKSTSVGNDAKLPVSCSLRALNNKVDFAYFCGVFNVSGIDGLQKEIDRLKAIGKEPHDFLGISNDS